VRGLIEMNENDKLIMMVGLGHIGIGIWNVGQFCLKVVLAIWIAQYMGVL